MFLCIVKQQSTKFKQVPMTINSITSQKFLNNFQDKRYDKLLSVDDIDLDSVLEVLCRPTPYGRGWDSITATTAISEYRRFLKLNMLNPGGGIVPTIIVDEVWHTHILDTRKYANDCEATFGYFLHHFPHFGMRQDAAARDNAFKNTNLLYTKEFGSPLFRNKKSSLKNINKIQIESLVNDNLRNLRKYDDLDIVSLQAAGCDAMDSPALQPAGCDAMDSPAFNKVSRHEQKVLLF
jgi:hypothetical protein